MKQVRLTIAFFVATMIFTLGCERKASDEIDFGTFKDSVYQNEYFGLSVSIPSDWSVPDQETRQQLMDMSVKIAAGDDKNLQATLKASEMSTVSFFIASKHPLGTPVLFNQNISCFAERVSHLPGIKSGEDYLFHVKRNTESSQLEASFPEEVTTESLGDKEFKVLLVELSMMNMTVHSKTYVTIMKGYALVFIMSYTTEEEESSLKDILDSVTFN